MANVKISALPALTSLANVDVLPVFDTDGSPVTKTVTALALAQYASARLIVPPVTPPAQFTVPDTVDATGITDATAGLLAYFATVPDGNTITFPDSAIYRIDGSVKLTSRHDLVFEGNGARFEAPWSTGDRERRHWWFKYCTGITCRDMVVRGANPNAGTGDAAYVADLEAQHGFDFDGCEDCLVERCTITDIYGDFFYVGVHFCKRITVQDCVGDRNGRQGFGITYAEDIVFQRNTFSNVRRSMIDVEPTASYYAVKRVLIDSNTFGAKRLTFVASLGASAVCEDITISNNTLLAGCGMNMDMKPPASGVRRGPITIHNNVTVQPYGSSLPVIRIQDYDGVTITDNVIECQSGRNQVPIGLYRCTDITIAGNTYPGTSTPPYITP